MKRAFRVSARGRSGGDGRGGGAGHGGGLGGPNGVGGISGGGVEGGGAGGCAPHMISADAMTHWLVTVSNMQRRIMGQSSPVHHVEPSRRNPAYAKPQRVSFTLKVAHHRGGWTSKAFAIDDERRSQAFGKYGGGWGGGHEGDCGGRRGAGCKGGCQGGTGGDCWDRCICGEADAAIAM